MWSRIAFLLFAVAAVAGVVVHLANASGRATERLRRSSESKFPQDTATGG